MVVRAMGQQLLPFIHRTISDQKAIDNPPKLNPLARRHASKVKEERHRDLTLAAAQVAAGLVLFGIGKTAWGRSPLRGGLSVFGAAPALDRCASQARTSTAPARLQRMS
jgi:hypothetical protein